MLHLICITNCSILPKLWVTITYIYTYLIVFKDSEEHSDILTNLQASQTHLDFINTGFLRALDSLPTSITSTLETAPPPHLPSVAVPHTSVSTTVNASTGLNSRLAPKKVRMSRVPAGVIPGVTPAPDPERWLKKSERSTYGQGKRRKGASGGGGATQGSASVDSPVTTPISHPSKTGGGKGKKKRWIYCDDHEKSVICLIFLSHLHENLHSPFRVLYKCSVVNHNVSVSFCLRPFYVRSTKCWTQGCMPEISDIYSLLYPYLELILFLQVQEVTSNTEDRLFIVLEKPFISNWQLPSYLCLMFIRRTNLVISLHLATTSQHSC